MMNAKRRVVVLGASQKPERYSNMAINRLMEAGHEVIPIHPALERIGELKVLPSLAEVEGEVDTLTIYLSPRLSSEMADAIAAVRPGRVIFNPGTENAPLEAELNSRGIPTLHACSLVLLSTGQF